MAWKRKPPPNNVRRVASIGKNIRGVTTNKCGRLVQFESEQERKLILLLEKDTGVTDFISQPETLFYADEQGKQHRYTPDFQVWYDDGRIALHEVTIAQRQQTRANLVQRTAAAQAICQQRGWQYCLHTEETLPTGIEYANLDFLSPYRAQTYAQPESIDWWLSYMAGQDHVSVQMAVYQSPPEYTTGILLNGLYHMLWHGQVQMNWQRPFIHQGALHPAATVWLAQSTPSGTAVATVEEVAL